MKLLGTWCNNSPLLYIHRVLTQKTSHAKWSLYNPLCLTLRMVIWRKTNHNLILQMQLGTNWHWYLCYLGKMMSFRSKHWEYIHVQLNVSSCVAGIKHIGHRSQVQVSAVLINNWDTTNDFIHVDGLSQINAPFMWEKLN